MKKNVLLGMMFLLAAVSLRAQYNAPQSRIWAMGNKVGLDFTNPANPTPITTNLANAGEAAASICDNNGQLLFYTNGMVVWDRNGVQMPNGGSLIGMTGSTLSTSQGAVIVPVPDSAGKYYLFSLTAVSNCKLYCNKIDMSLNNGSGDVVTSFPLRTQSLVDSALTEKMTAVPGCDNSVWLVVHTQGSPVFRSYHITPSGINLTPVLSPTGNFAGSYYQQGVIKFSTDRTRMINANFRATAPTDAGVEVFDFNYQTGVISNAITLHNGSYYGAVFSPDGRKAYAGSTAVMNTGTISQWDLTAASPNTTTTVLGACGQYTDLKIGPDGKIYFGALIKSNGYNNYRFMGRINAPNMTGAAAGFQDSVSSIAFPHATNANIGLLSQGMPNDVAVPVPATNQYLRSLDTTVCAMLQSFAFEAPAGYSSRTWDNNDTTAMRTVTTRGTYWVRSVSACDVRVDTFVISGADMPALAITRNNLTLTATTGFSGYQWYRNSIAIAGATGATYTIGQNGSYSVAGAFTERCHDSVSVEITDAVSVSNISGHNDVRIYPNPANTMIHIASPLAVTTTIRSLDGRLLLQANNSKELNVASLPNGTYILQVNDANGAKVVRDQMIQIIH